MDMVDYLCSRCLLCRALPGSYLKDTEMYKPYYRIVLVSVALTVLYFYMEERPAYVNPADDNKDVMFYGALYVVLLSGILSLIYYYYKKDSNKGRRQ